MVTHKFNPYNKSSGNYITSVSCTREKKYHIFFSSCDLFPFAKLKSNKRKRNTDFTHFPYFPQKMQMCQSERCLAIFQSTQWFCVAVPIVFCVIVCSLFCFVIIIILEAKLGERQRQKQNIRSFSECFIKFT